MAEDCQFTVEDLQCPVCCEVFDVPVTLSCKHSFCKTCVKTHWDCRGTQQCPLCRCTERSSRPPINLALKIASDVFKKKQEQKQFRVKSVEFCSIHNEELKLFCRKDAEFICVVCTSSRDHRNHEYCPIVEATSEIMKVLTTRYNPLKKQLTTFKKLKGSLKELEAYIQKQAAKTAAEVKQEYAKLCRILREEEAARLMVLQNESDSKTEVVREKLKEVNKSIEELSDIINYIEPIIIADDLTFLKECKEAIRRTNYIVPEPEYPTRALIDVSMYLGSLKHGVWKRMENDVSYCSVHFDPNTAHPNLIIRDELTTISYGEKQQLPDNPDRCMGSMAVLAARGFNSGKQRWDVEVAHSKEWYVGVAQESIKRKTAVFLSPAEGFWVIANNEESYWAQTSPRTRLTLKKKPQVITVELDYDKGKVSFSNAADGASIYTFKEKFTERVFPYFAAGINKGNTLRICAL
ncbi:zinc-binding protein A33-like [Rhinichthys klamathensis goyatoka]|uniref:zinc-binding protein A33-like n=1 Tax=Rhinichthys klamathensis goyatoka TaxID=3034132 RepID=UPI0024B4A3CF|nr:zinc-binding protein A33-like [Rhinichthys klamathensis goyatoka]